MVNLDPRNGQVTVAFFGRGGQGIKTAARVLGRALFIHGYNVQDFPLYGAERRGAPVYSYVRASALDIEERGSANADITVLVDRGVSSQAHLSGIVIANSKKDENGMLCVDLTSSISRLGVFALSIAAAAAAAAVIAELDVSSIKTAIEKEIRVPRSLLEVEQALAEDLFYEVKSKPLPKPWPEEKSSASILELSPEPWELSNPIIKASGTSVMRKTGSWRVKRPVITLDRCKACFLCYVACPESVITLDEKHMPSISYDNCKGCMICKSVCPFGAIQEYPETEVQPIA
ncbi:MAG: 2-oxoacid:acceptor oxidoreductase family protein [Thermoprotei archaeon]|nr:2-oxoacid:acceptor oxidoreductase family protein [TACK group archaeon]